MAAIKISIMAPTMQRTVDVFHCRSSLFIELGDLENIHAVSIWSFVPICLHSPRYNYNSDVEGPHLEIWCQATSDNVGLFFIE